MLHSSRLFFSFIISYPPLQPSSSSDEESSDEELSDSGDTENILNHSTTKKKSSEFDMVLLFIVLHFSNLTNLFFHGQECQEEEEVCCQFNWFSIAGSTQS